MRTILSIAVCFIILLSVQLEPVSAGDEFEEYEVKAVFMANFLKFVEWPARGRDSSYRLCIYGSDPFGQSIRVVEGMKIKGKGVDIRKISSVKSAGECNMLFISSSERRRIQGIIEVVRSMDVLTVGDTDGYGQEGVMLNFYIEASKVKFEVNLASIRQSRITISSQLLKLGKVVSHD